MLFEAQSNEERRQMILNGKVINTLLFLSIPTLLVGIIQALIPLSDSLFLNRLTSVEVASSVTFSQPVLNIMIALSQGLGVATLVMLGRLYGKGRMLAVKETMLQIFVFSFFIGLLLIPVCMFTAFLISNSTTSEIRNNVYTYISLYSLIMPFIFLAAIYNSSKNAIGRPEVTFVRIFLLLILKIIFNSIFLYVLKMGIVGAVMASLFSYIVVTIWMFYDLFLKSGDIKLNLRSYTIKLPIIKRLLKIGFPSMLNYAFLYLGFFLINKEMEKFGAVALNAQGIASNINAICFILPSSIGTTVSSMISINMGIGNVKKSKDVFKVGWITGVTISILTIALILPISLPLVLTFTKVQKVIEIADKALHIYTYSVIGFSVFMIAQGVFIALGRTKVPLVMSILRIWLLRYIFILLTQKYLGLYSIFWGNLFSNTLAGIIFFILVKVIDWKKGIKAGK
ncbi:MATE family efflux transporter [Leptotrichia sp. oral taxon 879]|uniref:MATE family efflux transporter n=1 Tax=Leptotrichia sp. oral taxon 879 TaxID=1227267 RepID=UPI0003AE42E1|nr:MATE family efflux transporter [Leptotrichia sp. oral taxon 879]ERK50922.1 MATE efflux family protein [Leptotrichia sp. oral taxon 879 str. F0557]